MSTINRTQILRGPGSVKLGSLAIFDATGITAEVEQATEVIPSSISGILDTIKTDQIGKISFTPCGHLSADLIAALFPYQTPVIGASIFGSDDVPCDIHSLAGTKVTFVNTAVTKLPEIYLSPVKTAFGGVELTALLGKNKEPGDADAFYKVAAATYSAGNPSPDGIVGVHYNATYGSITINDTSDGWTVVPTIELAAVQTDKLGTIDYTLSGVTVTASCKPYGLTESQILSALNISGARGSSMRGASDLVITGTGGLTVTLKNASLTSAPLEWGTAADRVGKLQFTAHRSFSNNVAGALYTVALASNEN